ncbi:hypothetical protein ACFPTX_00130 [Pseudomonas sp. GCM10022188]|uniref:hypothetical protein n=1 Tax=Pseudomonas TaxID=286 RepID=UPI001E5BC09D|nr:hypothetical protein [Pseudomonas oryzagri]MCC6077411.1 hypothetical protein [Pseudomonas oryzagri]
MSISTPGSQRSQVDSAGLGLFSGIGLRSIKWTSLNGTAAFPGSAGGANYEKARPRIADLPASRAGWAGCRGHVAAGSSGWPGYWDVVMGATSRLIKSKQRLRMNGAWWPFRY